MTPLHLVVVLECSFLQNNILGEVDTTIFERVTQVYLKDFCARHLKNEDALTIYLLNANISMGSYQMQFRQSDNNRNAQIEQFFSYLKTIVLPTSPQPFSLLGLYENCKILLDEVDYPMIANIICSSNKYQPLGSGVAELEKLNELTENSVAVNVIDFSSIDENPLEIDSFCLGFNYFRIANSKTQLSSTLAKTLLHLVKPVVPEFIWIFDTNILIQMTEQETKLVFWYISNCNHSVCFPRRVIQELDGLKNNPNLTNKIRSQQRRINSLGSLRYCENVQDVQLYIRAYNNGNVNADEEIIMASKRIKDTVCPNLKIVSNDIGVKTLAFSYGIDVIDLSTLLGMVNLNSKFVNLKLLK